MSRKIGQFKYNIKLSTKPDFPSLVNTNNNKVTDQTLHVLYIFIYRMLACCQLVVKEDSSFAHRLFTLLPADLDMNLSLKLNSPTPSNKVLTCPQQSQMSGGMFGFRWRDFCRLIAAMWRQTRDSRNVTALTVTRCSFWEAVMALSQEGSRGEVEDLQFGLRLVLLLTNSECVCVCVCVCSLNAFITWLLCLLSSEARVFELCDEVLLASRCQ